MKRQMKRRTRIQIVSKTRFTLSILLILLFVSSSVSLAMGVFDSEGADVTDYIEVYVASGDSLWTIAKDVNATHYQNEVDIRKLIYSIRKLNSLDYDCVIHPGDKLLVPITN